MTDSDRIPVETFRPLPQEHPTGFLDHLEIIGSPEAQGSFVEIELTGMGRVRFLTGSDRPKPHVAARPVQQVEPEIFPSHVGDL